MEKMVSKDQDKRTLLQINSYYVTGGFYFYFFEKLKEMGYKFRVFVPALKGKSIEHNNKAEYIDLNNSFTTVDRFMFFRKHLKIYKALLKTYPNIADFNLVHAHTLFSNGYIAYKIKKNYGTPYIVAVRGTDITFFLRKRIFLRELGIKILCGAEKIIFISPAHKKEVLEKYVTSSNRRSIDEKSIVISNGVDEFWIKSKINQIKRKGARSDIKLLYVGEVNRNKNLILTCQAIKRLVNDGINISYTIVGPISDKVVYKKLKQYTFVSYLGVMNKEQLIDVYRENDIFIMVSKSETFGLVYVEALTQGLPIIYSKGQGFDGYFEEGYVGYSANSNDVSSILNAIKLVNENYEKLAANCVKAGEKFSWNLIVQEYDRIYKETIR